MSDFRNIILEAISSYKELVKKNTKRTERTSKIRQIGIKRSNIKAANDIQLYQMGLNIVVELKKDIKQPIPEITNGYHGTKEFLHHLETLLSNYKVKNDQVINTNQKTACALVSAIQLLTSTTPSTISQYTKKQFNRYSKLVLTHGTEKQKKTLNDAISNYPKLDLET